MKRLALLLCLLTACQPSETQSGPDKQPISAPKATAKPPRGNPTAQPDFGTQTVSSPLPDNPWDALAVLNPLQLAAVRQAFVQRDDRNITDPALRRKVDYLLQLMVSAYSELMHPHASHSVFVPKGAQGFRLITRDDLPLKALYVKAAKPTRRAVILLHGYGANKEHMWIKYGFLHDDYNLLIYDSRGHNDQPGKVTLGILEPGDLEQAIRWLRGQGNQAFALMGESMGAAVAIVGGARWSQSPEQKGFPLKAVWSDSAYADLHHAVSERAMARLRYEAPNLSASDNAKVAEMVTELSLGWLSADLGIHDLESQAAPRLYLGNLVQQVAYAQVHSTEDDQTSYENARQLEAAARAGNGIPPLIWATTGEHVESWRDASYAPRLRAFLAKAFATP